MIRPEEYGDWWADIYDDYIASRGSALDPGPAIAFLAGHAEGGPILELGVGTGRVAIPLAALGLEVAGIEASSKMIERLRGRPGGERIAVTLSDIARFESNRCYRLIYLAYNMLFHLTDQESQVSCLDASARALVPGGRLVIEFHIPDLSGFRDGATCRVARLGPAEVELRVSEHHPIEQKIVSQHVWLGEGKVRVRPVVVRYAWPAETDLMARMAGLDVEARYGDWDRRPFGSDSRTCISVYRKPG